jgi:hypothetical protein
MRTYRIQHFHQIAASAIALRGYGFRAWVESHNGENLLCTDATLAEVSKLTRSGWVVRVSKTLLPV